jgi:ribosomal protein S18 acetylase RimI-like enzyme
VKIDVCRAKFENLPEIAQLFNAYREFYQQPDDLPLAFDFIEKRFINDESVVFYAKDEDGKYLGFTQLYPSFSSVSAKRIWVLNDLFVSAEIRNSGVGHMLLERAREFATETESKGIALQTTLDNTRAQKLYESLGYQKDKGYYAYFLTL